MTYLIGERRLSGRGEFHPIPCWLPAEQLVINPGFIEVWPAPPWLALRIVCVLDPGLRLDAVATSCWPPRDRCGI